MLSEEGEEEETPFCTGASDNPPGVLCGAVPAHPEEREPGKQWQGEEEGLGEEASPWLDGANRTRTVMEGEVEEKGCLGLQVWGETSYYAITLFLQPATTSMGESRASISPLPAFSLPQPQRPTFISTTLSHPLH